MECQHFLSCGSCNFYEKSYEEQVEFKKERLSSIVSQEVSCFVSPKTNYRSRAEFRVWHDGDKCSYAMGNAEKNGVVLIEECPKVLVSIEERMWEMLRVINKSNILKHKLFSVEFLASTLDEVLVTLIYHKKLDEDWVKVARELEAKLDISLIGRSKGQKLILSKESVTQNLDIDGVNFWYLYYDGGFTQPNPFVNTQMVSWACAKAATIGGGDLLESYCGLGNFTLPLSRYFSKVLATEVSKRSIANAKENCLLNKITNISFVRLSSEELSQALKQERAFNRLKDIDLESFNFRCVLVDPPRAGLDSGTLEIISSIEYIIYISCNPETLSRDLEILRQTHEIVDAAMFDQFPYTEHIESGVFLKLR